MSSHSRRAMLLLAGVLMPQSALAADVLTVAEVEAVSLLTGVRAVARGTVTGAQGALNFIGSDGKLLLVVSLGAAKDYREAQEMFVKRTTVTGVGDESFHPVDFDHALYVRKGDRMVGLGSGLNANTGKPILSQAQLLALAKLVLGRI